ncbi:MAG: hypothetical protein NTW52_05715 [Planctomycetota bacterium]|nr:hypothetical protein [Planctomycetota bacterium]
MKTKIQQVKPSVQAWLASINTDWPIVAVEKSVFEGSLRDLLMQHPDLVGSETEAVLWLRLGLIDRAHDIVQDGKRGTAAFLHAIVHRLEGDYWNSKYWIRQVRDESLLEAIGGEIIQSLDDPSHMELALKLKLISSSEFQFNAFVDTCANLTKAASSLDGSMSMVQRIVQSEWHAIARRCW